MNDYAAYGLRIRSNRPLPGFAPATGEGVPVIVDFAGAPEPDVHQGGEGADEGPQFRQFGWETIWHRADGSWRLRYVDPRDGASWTADLDRTGTHVTIRWSSAAQLADIPAVLQGPVLAAVLHLRRVPVLHAAVLAVDGHAVAVLGRSGAGKSTTGAAFVARGFASLSDDLAVLALDGGVVHVQPGCPGLRAFVDAARAAGLAPETCPRVFRAAILSPKRHLALSVADGTFHAAPLPLRAVYHLDHRSPGADRPVIEPLPARRALPVLLDNRHSPRFLDADRQAWSFRSCAQVAAATAVRTVRAPDDLRSLPRLVDAIVADAAALDPH
jgi:hypothetical protein